MKKVYIIIFDKINNDEIKDEFVEIIRSNFISKQAKEFAYVVFSNSESEDPKIIYELIDSKINSDVSFIVVDFNSFYGILFPDTLEWLKSHIPDSNWYND